jgi:hypothetical protein
MKQLRRVYLEGLAFPKELQGQAEWFVLWQRVAGGLSGGQQQELLQRYRTQLGIGGRKDVKRINPQVEREGWRLFASLELLPASARAALGNELLERLKRQPDNPAFLWSLGRFGARIPSYGPLNTCVPAASVARWLETLLSRGPLSADAQAAIVSMAARTGDPHRDIDEPLPRAPTADGSRRAGRGFRAPAIVCPSCSGRRHPHVRRNAAGRPPPDGAHPALTARASLAFAASPRAVSRAR